jgi:hypothetical protein
MDERGFYSRRSVSHLSQDSHHLEEVYGEWRRSGS